MSLRARRLNLAANALFLTASGIYAQLDQVLYRTAVIVILAMLYALWVRSTLWRAAQSRRRQRMLDKSEETLDLILTDLGEPIYAHPNRS